MEIKRQRNAVMIPAVVLIITIGNYSRLTGNENIRSIQEVSLIAIGMALGVFLVQLIRYIRSRRMTKQ